MSLHSGAESLVVVRHPQAERFGLANRFVVGQSEVEADEDSQQRVAVVRPDDGDDVVTVTPEPPSSFQVRTTSV
jgi:hypothetical protein